VAVFGSKLVPDTFTVALAKLASPPPFPAVFPEMPVRIE